MGSFYNFIVISRLSLQLVPVLNAPGPARLPRRAGHRVQHLVQDLQCAVQVHLQYKVS